MRDTHSLWYVLPYTYVHASANLISRDHLNAPNLERSKSVSKRYHSANQRLLLCPPSHTQGSSGSICHIKCSSWPTSILL